MEPFGRSGPAKKLVPAAAEGPVNLHYRNLSSGTAFESRPRLPGQTPVQRLGSAHIDNLVRLAHAREENRQGRLVAGGREFRFQVFQAPGKSSGNHGRINPALAIAAARAARMASAMDCGGPPAINRVGGWFSSGGKPSFASRRRRASQIASAGVRPCSSRRSLLLRDANRSSSVETLLLIAFIGSRHLLIFFRDFRGGSSVLCRDEAYSEDLQAAVNIILGWLWHLVTSWPGKSQDQPIVAPRGNRLLEFRYAFNQNHGTDYFAPPSPASF